MLSFKITTTLSLNLMDLTICLSVFVQALASKLCIASGSDHLQLKSCCHSMSINLYGMEGKSATGMMASVSLVSSTKPASDKDVAKAFLTTTSESAKASPRAPLCLRSNLKRNLSLQPATLATSASSHTVEQTPMPSKDESQANTHV